VASLPQKLSRFETLRYNFNFLAAVLPRRRAASGVLFGNSEICSLARGRVERPHSTGGDMAKYDLRVNGFRRSIESDDPGKPLLYVLRGMGLTATKYGCGLGQCGACTVMIDGAAVRSCQTRVSDLAGKSITTMEGLSNTGAQHPVQAAFIKEQVPQCGYCTSGMIMSSVALLERNKKPSEAEIRSELDANLCRCGSHVRVVRAVMAASGQSTTGQETQKGG
jgi:nicotinate dehydrogenase subunit A